MPYSIATLLGTITLITILIFFNFRHSSLEDKNLTLATNHVPKPSSIPINTFSEVILEPSMQFMQTITPSAITSHQSQILASEQISTPKNVPHIVPRSNLVMLPVPAATPSRQAISLKTPTIKHGSDAIDIHEIEERFKTNPSPQLGLYIARYYYDHKDYNEAYNYALKTNSINKDIEESWLIFSKSLLKLGKVDQAKKTLQYYISQSNSDNAKELLNSIEHGDVK